MSKLFILLVNLCKRADRYFILVILLALLTAAVSYTSAPFTAGHLGIFLCWPGLLPSLMLMKS